MTTSQLGTSDSYLGNVTLGPGVFTLEPEIAHNLIFVQSVTIAYGDITINQPIVFVQALVVNATRERELTNTITFNQVADVIKTKLVNQTITFVQDADVEKTKGIIQTITFAQTATSQYAPHNDSQSQMFDITETVTVSKAFGRSVTNALTFAQSATFVKRKYKSVSQLFVMSQSAAITIDTSVTNQISFVQNTATAKILHRSLSNIITFNQTVTKQTIWTRATSNFFNVHNGGTKQDGSLIVNIPGALVTKKQNKVILEVPGKVLLLPKPLLGNREQELDELIIQRAIDSTKYVYVRRNEKKKLNWTFQVKKNKCTEIVNFMKDNLSQAVTIKDWKGNIWYGYILTNPIEFTVSERFGQHEFDFEFEGIKIN